MKLEKGEISSSQLMFLVGGFIQGSLLTLAFAKDATKHDLWLALIAALMMSLPLALVYITLALKFPGQNLFQINDAVFGPYLGKLVSFQYIMLFLMIVSSNLWFAGDFFLTFFFPETPIIVIMIMFAFICAWGVRAGIEVIARMSIILVLFTILIALTTFILLLNEMKFSNFLPIFDIPIHDFIQGTNIMMAIPFNEVIIFMMVIPYANKMKQVKTSVLYGLMIGGITSLIVVIRNTAVLGPLADIVVSPSMEAVRLIDLGEIIERLEALVGIGLILSMFLKVSVFYYATVLGMAQLLKLRSYVPLVIPVGIIGITLALTNESSIQFTYTAMNTYPIFSLSFYIVLPLISLLIVKIRKLPK
ncbi:Spore germination protein GerKB [Desulfosporosinus sp. I2]|uniref:GerAB/ArcD/ProY family transporter n=1 Tax=Desulfosporosinus sp. I2 TaxID=1617025 RepID=UPI00061FDB53|nr:endospore germination permease [Desulfosporosinus sp. I2]KJR44897.1 Spore germination protein GerKB [Desulfosporosinus sp. I2]